MVCCRYSFDGTSGYTILFFDTYDYIASAYIVKVIGESADAVVDAVRIPSFFEFDPVALYFLLSQEVFYVDGLCHCLS